MVWGGWMKYIKNLRCAIKKLNDEERIKMAYFTKQILVKEKIISEDVRRAEIKTYIDNFAEGGNTKLKYLEGFLEALEKIKDKQSVENALLTGSLERNVSWRDILLTITNDIPSENLRKHYDNEFILLQLKSLFKTLAERCVVDDAELTMQRLILLNELLQSETTKQE